MAAKKKNEVALVTNLFPALSQAHAVAEVIAINLEGRPPSMFDLERIKLGAGETPVFTIHNALTGEIDTVKEIECVIAFWKDGRAYWSVGMDEGGGGTPPDCRSDDLLNGIGNNGTGDGLTSRSCQSCPHNQFGSAKEGNGKACKDWRGLFILRTGGAQGFFPSLLMLPPSSLKPMQKYLMALTGAGMAFYGAMHSLEIVIETQKGGGNKYCQMRPNGKKIRALTTDESEAIATYGGAMKAAFAGVNVVDATFAGEEMKSASAQVSDVTPPPPSGQDLAELNADIAAAAARQRKAEGEDAGTGDDDPQS